MNKNKIKENVENLFYTFLSIGKVLMNSKFFIDIKELREDVEECIILGNGPSLKDSINDKFKDFLDNKKIFCVNAFAVSKEYLDLKPNYYIFADPGLWIENPRETVRKLRDDIFNSIIEKTKWDLTIFFPYEVRRNKIIKHLPESNPHIKIKYFNKVTVMGFSFFRNLFYKHNLGIPRAQNVIIPTLILALNLGFKKIYLFGADHSWHENLVLTNDNILCFKDVHFYDDNELVDLIAIRDNTTKKNLKVHEEFYSIYLTLKIYFYIKEYAKTKDASVINASAKTYIDAFDRMIL